MNGSTFRLNRYSVVMFLLIFFGVFLCAAEIIIAESELPFAPGEKLTFQLKWGFIPAGEAVLEVQPIKNINGIKAYHFVLTAKSNSFVDIFYKVRDRIDAYADLNMTHTLLYNKQQHEGNTKRNVTVNFDWEKNTAQYINFGLKNKPISIMPGSFDPLSAFYYTRLVDLKENAVITSPVTDGKKCVVGKAKIVKREKIKLASGIYDTYLMEPELKHIGGVFKKSKNAKIQLWVSADKRRSPLKIKSKVVVGSFVGELISAEGTGNP
ncbi:DUF3108 domain-containing protein [Thermodesulfobacteriota bacterium]